MNELRREPLPAWLAVVLVVGTSAAVLILEILAGRLLAPYVGVSLETYTGIIGTVLTGIAVGAWVGGYSADRVDPRRLLPMLLAGGGALAVATIPIVRMLGRTDEPHVVLLTALGFLPSATALSAVPPAVIKLQLSDLTATGRTVGRLSAYGTAGAIFGTFLSGFVLVRWAAVTTLVVAVGVALIVGGIALGLASRPRRPREVAATTALGLLAVAASSTINGPCHVQTRYYCASIVVDPERPTGRTLLLDDLRHSYVDLADPTHLEFWYARRVIDSVDATLPSGALDVAYIGGGGLSLPRYVRATRPGSRQTVFEIDNDLVRLVESQLQFDRRDDVAIDIGDGRLGLARLAEDSVDAIVGDAFGSRAVPWHLTTREFLSDVRRVLRPGGLYALNLIDTGAGAFLRAETATLAHVFQHVVVVLGAAAADGRRGNSVLLASDRPIDIARVDPQGGEVVGDVADLIRDATILTDDFAPVDQLLDEA